MINREIKETENLGNNKQNLLILFSTRLCNQVSKIKSLVFFFFNFPFRAFPQITPQM